MAKKANHSLFRFVRFKNRVHVPVVLKRNPILAVLAVMVVLIILIGIGSYLRNGNGHEQTPQPPAKQVAVYRIGSTPTVKALAKVEKQNVFQVRAQKAGIVQKLYVEAGDIIAGRGKTLAYISDNYQGGNAAGIQRQIAQKQYDNTKDTYQQQKDVIGEQRNIANRTDENADELREISKKSIDETKSLISLNESIISYLDENIAREEATPSGQVNRDVIAQNRQLKSSFVAALNSLRSGLRTTEYQTNNDEAYAQLSEGQKNLALKQLDIQEKALDLTLEVSRLQVQLAGISSSMAYPTSFSKGQVEKVHVRVGQQVNPGELLFTITGAQKAATLTALVPKRVAQTISEQQAATVLIGSGETLSLTPSYISQEVTDGSSYSIQFMLPETAVDSVSDGEFIQMNLPVGVPNTTVVMPFIPLDAVYQSNQGAYVFINQDGVVTMKPVTLGQIYGHYVQVQEGLTSDDAVILDRTVIEGDRVELND